MTAPAHASARRARYAPTPAPIGGPMTAPARAPVPRVDVAAAAVAQLRFNPKPESAPEMAWNFAVSAYHCDLLTSDEAKIVRKFTVVDGHMAPNSLSDDVVKTIHFSQDKVIISLMGKNSTTLLEKIRAIATFNKAVIRSEESIRIGHYQDTTTEKLIHFAKSILSTSSDKYNVKVTFEKDQRSLDVISYIFRQNYLCCDSDKNELEEAFLHFCQALEVGPRGIIIKGIVQPAPEPSVVTLQDTPTATGASPPPSTPVEQEAAPEPSMPATPVDHAPTPDVKPPITPSQPIADPAPIEEINDEGCLTRTWKWFANLWISLWNWITCSQN